MSRFKRSFVVCDHCGKEFEDIPFKTPTVMWMQFQSWNGNRKYTDGETRYDLCTECEREFINWFSNHNGKLK